MGFGKGIVIDVGVLLCKGEGVDVDCAFSATSSC